MLHATGEKSQEVHCTMVREWARAFPLACACAHARVDTSWGLIEGEGRQGNKRVDRGGKERERKKGEVELVEWDGVCICVCVCVRACVRACDCVV